MKKNTILYIIITILLIVIAVGITYIIVDNKNEEEVIKPNDNQEENNNKEEEPTIEDGITLKNTYQEGDNIIQEYEVILNGNKSTLNVEYSYEYLNDIIAHHILGNLNDTNIFESYKRDNYDDSNNTIIPNYNKKELFNSTALNKEFNENNFEIIKGTDNKNYLVIYSEYHDTFSNGEDTDSSIYILNDKLEIINENMDFDLYNQNYNVVLKVENAIPWYEDTTCQDEFCHRILKIEDNKIYYLVTNLKENYQIGDYGTLEERVYTINNSQLTYEVINTYKITEMGNMI